FAAALKKEQCITEAQYEQTIAGEPPQKKKKVYRDATQKLKNVWFRNFQKQKMKILWSTYEELPIILHIEYYAFSSPFDNSNRSPVPGCAILILHF
ncbi:unnamed protein product, partial [Allacma fusca]